MPKRIFAVLGAKYEQIPLIKMARENRFSPLAFDFNKSPAGKYYCDHFHQVSYRDENAILGILKRYNVAGVGTIGTNDAICVVSSLNDKLKLPGLYDDADIIRRATYKDLWRDRLRERGISIPLGGSCNQLVEAEQAASELGLPLILKPADSSGAKGVGVVNKKRELQTSFDNAYRHSTSGKVIIEKYIGHNSFAAESFVTDGDVHLVAIGQREISPPPLCVGLGVTVPDNLSDTARSAIRALNREAIEGLGISYGPVHIDMVIDSDDKPYIIDMGPRLVAGPFGWEHIYRATGFDILEAVFFQAIGKKLNEVKTRRTGDFYAHRYLTASKSGIVIDVKFSRQLLKESDILSYRTFVRGGDKVRALENARHRYGYVTACDTSFEALNKKIDAFLSEFKIVVDGEESSGF